MSAQALQVAAQCIRNAPNSNSERFIETIPGSVSYQLTLTSNITTLSTNGTRAGDVLRGLLFVPDLPSDNVCGNATASYIPQNVTRLNDLPLVSLQRIAFAPWISPECTLAFLNSAQQDSVEAMLFYLPGASFDTPPPETDPVWSLGDGGAWRSNIGFPLYSIPSAWGMSLMQASAAYSGNVTDAPFSETLAQICGSTNYVRLAAALQIVTPVTSLPSLWVFLLIVLGILLIVVGSTSIAMHVVQRRRRAALRRRVANGEVDLEALGIKRLTIPQDILDKMPLYTYGDEPGAKPSLEDGVTSTEPNKTRHVRSTASNAAKVATQILPSLHRSDSYHPAPLSQPTCAICLDDFVPAGTLTDPPSTGSTVRELPCRHIFHPECVDTFLRDNSSLCPMCKKSALPKGYCPQVITNAMVRRERIMRRTGRRPEDADDGFNDVESSVNPRRPWTSQFARFSRSRRDGSMPTHGATEMVSPVRPASLQPSQMHNSSSFVTAASFTTPPVQATSRREWARQRAVAMLGRRLAPEEPRERASSWRKALERVFPIFGR